MHFRTPTNSSMYLSSLATWRTATLLLFHRLDPAAQQRVVPWAQSLPTRLSDSGVALLPLDPALLWGGGCYLPPVTGPGLVGKLPKLAGQGAEGIQWTSRSWLSRGPVPRRRRDWQMSWYFLGDEGLGLAGCPASA